MLPRDIRVYHIFSCLLLPWSIAARLAPGAVSSPFALALAALAFALPYHVTVLHDPPWAIAESMLYHLLVVAVSPPDVSPHTLAVNVAAIALFHALADFTWLYAVGIPRLHEMCPKWTDRWRVMLGESRPCSTQI
jgi:hypothetical protein